MRLILFTATFLLSFTGFDAKKVCLKYLPGNGVDVSDDNNTVKFPPTKNGPRASKIATSYDSKGLNPFFNLAKSFMNTVQKKNFPSFTDANGKMKNMDELVKEVKAMKGQIYDFEVPIIAAVGVGIVLALLIPVIGCCFCCCRCCGKCGGEMIQSKKNSEAHCKCCLFSILLFVFAIFMLCGVLMMYVTNNNLKAEVAKSPKTYDNALNEGWDYIDIIMRQLEEITENKTNCLYEDLIVPEISDQGVKDQIGVKLKNLLKPHVTDALDSAKEATQNVSSMDSDLSAVSNATSILRNYASTLKIQLDKARSDLNEIKTNCSSKPIINNTCAGIQTNGLKQEANFTSLPNIDNELKNVRDIINQNFSGSVDEAFAIFNDIPNTVVNKAKPTLTNVRKLAKDGKEKLVNTSRKYLDKLNDFKKKKPDYQKYKTDYVDKYISYDKYRFYAFIGLSAIVTLIVLLLSLGLACGVCGYSRDNNPVQRSSSSHTGGNCVMISVGFMFFFAFILFLLTAIFLFVGEHLYIGCKELKDASIIQKYAGKNLKFENKTINIEAALINCRNDMPVYQALGGKKFFDIDKEFNISKLFNLDSQLDSLNFSVSDQLILNSNTKKSLQDLKNSSVDNINFTKFLNELDRYIVAVNLTQLVIELKNTSSSLRSTNQSEAINLANSIDNVASDLLMVQNDTIRNIKAQSDVLRANIVDVKKRANNLATVADNVLKKLEKASDYVTVNGSTDVSSLIKNYAKRVLGWPLQFVDHIFYEIKNNLARCKPIANVYDGILNVFFCTGIVRNFNGFWLATGWCLFFFPFTIIFGVKLAKYFRRMQMLSGFDSDPVNYPGYEQQAVKIPLQQLNGAAKMHRHGDGQLNPRYDGHGCNAAPPPYSA